MTDDPREPHALMVDLSDRQRWLTIGQAAGAARTTERTVQRWIASGRVVALRTAGGRVFIDRASLFGPAVSPMS